TLPIMIYGELDLNDPETVKAVQADAVITMEQM
ncbi:unnamed protein product, partial [marine sediment metagenome]